MVRVTTKNTIKTAPITDNVSVNASIRPGSETINANPSGVPSATEDHKGIIRIATLEEAIAGVDNKTAITPETLRKVTTYVHTQNAASDTWVIEHNLNKKPSVSVVDSAETIITPNEIIYTSENTITLLFLSSFGGKAYLN